MAVGRWRAAIAVLGLLAAGTASAETVLRRPTAAEPETPDVEESPRPRRSGWWQRARATIVGE